MKHLQRHFATLALGLATVAPVMAQGVETGAFVRKPASTIKALIYQVENDPVVADRFERHFSKSKQEVIEYFQSLHLARLRETGSFNVFNVHADGVIRARVFELKKGTLVFADPNGKPILKKNCANPLTMGELSVVRDERTEPTPTPLLPTTDIEPSEALVAAELVEPPFTPVGAEVTPPQPYLAAESHSIAGGAAGFAFVPLLFVFNKTTKVYCPDNPPVPEPATLSLIALGTGAAALIRRRRKARA